MSIYSSFEDEADPYSLTPEDLHAFEVNGLTEDCRANLFAEGLADGIRGESSDGFIYFNGNQGEVSTYKSGLEAVADPYFSVADFDDI